MAPHRDTALSVVPVIAKTKKTTGRYQLQFPRAWLQQLAGRTAEEWRAAVLSAFEGAAADIQRAWRSDFAGGKASMLKRTLTVAERSGRRFDRRAYLSEAQALYGKDAVPDSAPPKLLARCFQHSIDFAARRGLLGDAPLALLSTPRSAAPRRLKIVRRSATPELRMPTTPMPASSVACSATESASCSLQQGDGGVLSSILEDACSSLDALDDDLTADLFACAADGMLLSDPDVLSMSTSDALSDEVLQCSSRSSTALRASVERRSSVQCTDEETSGTAGSARVQVGDPAKRVEILEAELAKVLRDLEAAREQRDVAVRESQSAAVREASVLRQLDALRTTVKDAPTI